MTTDVQKSFSSANIGISAKVLKHPGLMSGLQHGGYIAPIHLQWMPTNRCNAHCSFCSCAGRDKSLELDFDSSTNAIETFAHLGTRAATITGGGEPMLYSEIYGLFDVFRKNGIEIGLVSNALNAGAWDLRRMRDFRWIRLSVSDEYEFGDFDEKIKMITGGLPAVDIALSYVIAENYSIEKIRTAMRVANENRLSHIRYVFDIRRSGQIDISLPIALEGLDTSRAIVQSRADYAQGRTRCLISLMKPIINADAYIYPCCGGQYATATAEAACNMLPTFRMGELGDIEDMWRHQAYFDGSQCEKCYYDNYNVLLGLIRDDVKHTEFV